MAYTKPQVIEQNNSSGSYAVGCPANQNALESNLGDKHGEEKEMQKVVSVNSVLFCSVRANCLLKTFSEVTYFHRQRPYTHGVNSLRVRSFCV